MKKNKKTWIAVIPLFLIVVFVLAGFGVWKKYRDTLMENQEEQLLLTTRILSENMSVAAREYEDNLEFLADITEEREAEDAENIYNRESLSGRSGRKDHKVCQGCGNEK